MGQIKNVFESSFTVGENTYRYFPISTIEGVEKLPYSLRILLENVLRNAKSEDEAYLFAQRIIDAGLSADLGSEVEFSPARVLFQDFTGVPVFVDFAVMREACKNLGGNPELINPQVPCDLVIDHSVIADEAGCAAAFDDNKQLEFKRNKERYIFLKWAQQSFENVRIVPPGAGICHQLNIEAFASVVMTKKEQDNSILAYFDTLVGTDSHTPTANGLGVLGWGVGGIEAEAAALGQAITTLVPRVVGLKFTGSLSKEVAAMDVSLKIAEILRAQGVVGCFVECFGEGLASLSATQRTCISNMTPEYGSTCTLFPVDEKTLDYLALTGRSAEQIALVEAYAKKQGLWYQPDEERIYSRMVEINLDEIKPATAGPSRPHEHISLDTAAQKITDVCKSRRDGEDLKEVSVSIFGKEHVISDGSIAIAAITSCTTATDPAMMLACGLIAKHAVEHNLHPKPWTKCILAPGSHATALLLKRAGLTPYLEKLGFYTCGFGCMSCIGNSGPILPALHNVADEIELTSVLSGNRNFDGRISPDVSQNYLAAPATVIAYALAGNMRFDFDSQPLGVDALGKEVFLSDIIPTAKEIDELLQSCVTETLYAEGNAGMYEGDEFWRNIKADQTSLFPWEESSTYVRRANYFDKMTKEASAPKAIKSARVLLDLGDFITTDHISPAGAIALDSSAADYLRKRGVKPQDFNTYGTRRGNHEVMARGTFANVKLQNKLTPGKKGAWTYDFDEKKQDRIFDVSQKCMAKDIPLVVLAGKMYGSGSSRDWAAKGPLLLGVKAVFAESYERIHRSNLIGMGILPLQFKEGENAEVLGLDGSELFDIEEIDFSKGLPNPRFVQVHATKPSGECVEFTAQVRIDTPTEGDYFYNGGILQYVLRNLVAENE